MKTNRSRAILASTLVMVMTACQTPLRSDLPAGESAYTAVSVPTEVAFAKNTTLVPGDEISVNVFQEEELSAERLVIDQGGYASLPLIGQIQAAGRSPAQLAEEIESAYATRFLRTPNVNVNLVEGVPRVVSVEGEVDSPGIYPIQRGYTLLSAMALAGSPTVTAKLDEILIFREINGERVGGRFNITDIRAGRMPDPEIISGDVIVVGFSAVRGAYQDFLRAAPLIGAFSRY